MPATGAQSAQASDNRPGGGLGPPIEAPDPLDKYRWWLLGGFVVVLGAGAVYIAKRPMQPRAVASMAGDVVEPVAVPAAQSASLGRSGLLLEALKEELFALEVEHKQGSLSQQEYEKAKAALDQTLGRALKRGDAKQVET